VIKNVSQFNIEFFSEEDQKTYSGTFTCKKASIMDYNRIQRRKSELNGGMYCVRDEEGNPTGHGIDTETEFLSFMIATLEIQLENSPIWFNLNEITDRDIVYKVFEEVMEFENSFRNRTRRAAKEAGTVSSGQGSSTEKHQEAAVANNPTKVVGKEVQASLDA